MGHQEWDRQEWWYQRVLLDGYQEFKAAEAGEDAETGSETTTEGSGEDAAALLLG